MNSEDNHSQDSVKSRTKKGLIGEYENRTSSEVLDKLDELQYFYDFSPVGYLTLDREGRILNANLTAAVMLEVPRNEIINQSLYLHTVREDRDLLLLHLRRLFSTHKPETCQIRIDGRKGESTHVRLDSIINTDLKGRSTVRMVVTDSTKQKQKEDALQEAEEALRKSLDELEFRVRERTARLEERTFELEEEIVKRKKFEVQLKRSGDKILREQNRRVYLSKKLVELLEKERQDIARALHDDIGQMLTSVNMDLEFLKSNACSHPPAIVHDIEAIQYRIKESTEKIRDLSRNLRPDTLDHLGLVPSIRSMLEGVKKRSKIECHLFTKDIPEKMDSEKDLSIYRIAQEAVTNCLRHARANNVFVNLIRKGRSMMLTIEDDGIGFEYDGMRERETWQDRLGLLIMNERTVQVGGEFRVESQVGKGTQVIVEIPME